MRYQEEGAFMEALNGNGFLVRAVRKIFNVEAALA